LKKKNLILFFTTSIFFPIVLYFLSFIYFSYIKEKNNIELIQYSEEIKFIEKYSKKLHHIRHYTQDFYREKNIPSELLFTIEQNHETNNERETFLFLGDSWIEQLIIYPSSRKMINDYFNKNKINYINAGISSYSPTLMMLQYKILQKEFNIKANNLVVYIDQTDFGDEICRYKQNRYFNNETKELEGVKNFLQIPKIVKLSKISQSNDYKILKDFKIFNFFINEKIKIIKNKTKKIFNTSLNTYGCSINRIFEYLVNPEDKDIKYFRNSVNNFLESLEKNKNIDRILVVTFPHRNQVSSAKNYKNILDYKINVADFINDYINENNSLKLEHLDFTDKIKQGEIGIFTDSYIQQDPSSHLNMQAHSNIFTRNLIKKIGVILE